MGSRTAIMSLLTFADKVAPTLWEEHESLLARMDLQGEYQRKNLRTVLTALELLGRTDSGVSAALLRENCDRRICDALIHTASRVGFHGRWEKLSDNPYVICDIGHNEHGLKYNLNSALSIGILAQQVHGNDSVMYAIDNLNHIFNRDKIKWDLTIQKMEVYNEAIIRDFILNSIKDVNILQDEDKVSGLLHLAVIVGDNVIINKIKNSLLELNKEV
jgi:hypothetical protein